MKVKQVTFLGYSGCGPDDPLSQQAFAVAAEVAREGWIVVNGGGPGIMRASTDGAHSVGGRAIGITFYPGDATFFEGRDVDNKVDELIELPNYVERTLKLLEYGDVFVIFNGGTGTISEFGMAWGLARLHFGHHKPFVLFGEFWYPILEEFAEHMKLRAQELKVYKIVTEVDHVVRAIRQFQQEFAKVDHNHNKSAFTV